MDCLGSGGEGKPLWLRTQPFRAPESMTSSLSASRPEGPSHFPPPQDAIHTPLKGYPEYTGLQAQRLGHS